MYALGCSLLKGKNVKDVFFWLCPLLVVEVAETTHKRVYLQKVYKPIVYHNLAAVIKWLSV